jgi:hypothetical protein
MTDFSDNIKKKYNDIFLKVKHKFDKLEKKPIEIFVRHCFFSSISHQKKMLPGFSKKKCYENLISTIDSSLANITFFFDSYHGSLDDYFLKEDNEYPIISIKEGKEALSFLSLLEYVDKKNFHPETIIYFLEDDYLHREGWMQVLLEAFELPIDYVTLFDHKDKYMFEEYKDLKSKLFQTKSSHFRTIPSTTNTYAMRFATLKRDMAIHRKYSEKRDVTADHEKFLELGEKSTLISPVPGFSTHCEEEFASPCVDWQKYFLSAPSLKEGDS